MTSQATPRTRILQTLNHLETDVLPYHIPIDVECMGMLENEGEATRDLLGRLDNHLPYLLIESSKHWIEQQEYSDEFGCVWKEQDQVPHLIAPPLKEPDLREYHFPTPDYEKYFSGLQSFFESAATALHASDPRVGFAIAVAPSIARDAIDQALAGVRLPSLLDLTVLEGRTHEAIRAADVALAKPGTVTLEVALLGTPQVVTTRENALSAWLIRRLVRVSSYPMPNLTREVGWCPSSCRRTPTPSASPTPCSG